MRFLKYRREEVRREIRNSRYNERYLKITGEVEPQYLTAKKEGASNPGTKTEKINFERLKMQKYVEKSKKQ